MNDVHTEGIEAQTIVGTGFERKTDIHFFALARVIRSHIVPLYRVDRARVMV